MKRIALIPAYKPLSVLIDTASGLKGNGFFVIIVNDGSGEGYDEVFEACEDNAVILIHKENKGKGAALKTGMKYVGENFAPPYLIVTVDADGQHKIPDVVNVSARAEEKPECLVLGSRHFSGNVPLRSRFGNTVTRYVFRLSSGTSVYDTQTGLRAFTDKLAGKLSAVGGERYEYEMNVLMEAARNKIPIIELPIETVYLNDNESSHFDTIKDSYRIYKEILKFSASSLISFCADYLLFCVLNALSGSTVAANITARVCSSVLNFNLNRKMVFKSDKSLAASAAEYFSLAAAILVCNTLLVESFCRIGISAYISKIMAELILFTASWLVQHKLIFKKGG